MATQNTLKFGDVTLLVADGADPDLFLGMCGITSINWQSATNENSEDLPNCGAPDSQSYGSTTITAISDTVQAQGFVDVSNTDAVYNWIQSGASRNVRILYSQGATEAGKPNGFYEGLAVATSRENAFERRQSGKMNFTIKFQRPPVWRAMLAKGGRFLAGAGLRPSSALSSAAAANNKVQRARNIFGTPEVACSEWTFLFHWGYMSGGEERAPTNDGSLNYFTIFDANNVPHEVRFGGALNKTFTPNEFAWTDPVVGFTNTPNEIPTWWLEMAVAVGQRYPVGYFPSLGGRDTGSGKESATDPDPTRRLTGIMASPSGDGNSQCWGPMAASCVGWDGVRRVYLLWGDSRPYATEDALYRLATRGCAGAAERGLDDLASGRIPFGNFSAPGGRAEKMPYDIALGSAGRRAALAHYGTALYTDLWTDLIDNDVNGGANPTFEVAKAILLASWAEQHAMAPWARIYFETGYVWSGDSNLTKYATYAGQIPPASATISREIADWAIAGIGVPSYVTVLNMRGELEDVAHPAVWKVPGGVGVLVSAVTRTIVYTGDAPVLGMRVVLGGGTANVESFQVANLASVGATHTVTTVGALTKTHTADEGVTLAYAGSDAHPGTILAKAAATNVVAPKKVAGIIKKTM